MPVGADQARAAVAEHEARGQPRKEAIGAVARELGVPKRQVYDAVVASGTATVQAAVIGNPFVVVYRVSPLTFRLAKRLVHYPPEIWDPAQTDADGNLPIAMVNLIAGRRIVPELLQERFTAQNVASELAPLISDTPERHDQIAALAELRHRLLPPGDLQVTPIERAADIVADLLHGQPAGNS